MREFFQSLNPKLISVTRLKLSLILMSCAGDESEGDKESF